MKRYFKSVVGIFLVIIGCKGKISGPSPHISTVVPQVGWIGVENRIEIAGDEFAVVVLNSVGNQEVKIPEVFLGSFALEVLHWNPQVITAVIPMNLPSGVYPLVVSNPNGKSAIFPDAYTLTSNPCEVPPNYVSVSSVSPAMGLTQLNNVVEIKGDGFVEGIHVWLAQGETCVSGELSVTFIDSNTLRVVIPSNIPDGIYSFVLITPEGYAGRIDNAYRLTSNPCELVANYITISSVSPSSVLNTQDNLVVVEGSGFMDGIRAWLADGSTCVDGELQVEYINSTTLHLTIPAGFPAGTYALVLVNPNGYVGRLDNALTVTTYVVVVSGVSPPFGWMGEATPIYVYGESFTSTPRVYLEDATGYQTEVTRVVFINENTIAGVVPAGMEPGLYTIVVVNPDLVTGRLEGAFRVTELPPPYVETVNPSTGDIQTDVTVMITGENFRDSVTYPIRITLIDSDYQEVKGSCADPSDVISVSNVTPTSITATIKLFSCGISSGAYLVRVMNTDEESYYDWSMFGVTTPAGDPNDDWEPSSYTLNRPRAGLCVVVGRDDLKRVYIYAIGGSDGVPGGNVYNDVEVAQLDPFGRVGRWHIVPRHTLKQSRYGAGCVEHNGWIYVVGGIVDDAETYPSSCTVEKAKILTSDTAPIIMEITSEPGGDLSEGAWYYRVSAVMDSTDTENPGGEGLPSDEWSIQVENGSKVIIRWKPPSRNPSAVEAYLIYRTDGPNGVSGEEHLIAVVSGTQTEFEDIGYPAGVTSYLPQGSTGKWMCENSVGLTPRYGFTAVKGEDALENVFIYAIGGKTPTGVTTQVEVIAINSDGSLDSTFNWRATAPLNNARYYHGGVFMSEKNAPVLGSRRFLYVLGGTGSPLVSNRTEYTEMVTGGDVLGWNPNTQLSPGNYGLMSVGVDDYIFIICGGDPANPRDTVYSGEILSDGTIVNFNAAGNAATTIWSRFLGGSVIHSAFIYLIGGYGMCTDTDVCTEPTTIQALDTVERVIW